MNNRKFKFKGPLSQSNINHKYDNYSILKFFVLTPMSKNQCPLYLIKQDFRKIPFHIHKHTLPLPCKDIFKILNIESKQMSAVELRNPTQHTHRGPFYRTPTKKKFFRKHPDYGIRPAGLLVNVYYRWQWLP